MAWHILRCIALHYTTLCTLPCATPNLSAPCLCCDSPACLQHKPSPHSSTRIFSCYTLLYSAMYYSTLLCYAVLYRLCWRYAPSTCCWYRTTMIWNFWSLTSKTCMRTLISPRQKSLVVSVRVGVVEEWPYSSYSNLLATDTDTDTTGLPIDEGGRDSDKRDVFSLFTSVPLVLYGGILTYSI